MADTSASENNSFPGTSSHEKELLTSEINKKETKESEVETESKLKELRSALTEDQSDENNGQTTRNNKDEQISDEISDEVECSDSKLIGGKGTKKDADSSVQVKGLSEVHVDSGLGNLSQGSRYIPPIEDPYDKAWKYLSKHNILSLFGTITADIVYGKPGDPLLFMVDEIERLQELDRVRKGVIKRTASAALTTENSGTDDKNDIIDDIPP